MRAPPLLVVAMVLGSCNREVSTPEETVAAFIEAMNESSFDPSAVEEAYALLARDTRGVLERRARLSTSLAAEDVSPASLLAPGRFRLRITPVSMRSRRDGDRVTVTVTGTRGETVELPLVIEEGAPRIVLRLDEREGPRERAPTDSRLRAPADEPPSDR